MGEVLEQFLVNSLELVYFPVSNQEAEWLWEDSQVREIAKRSQLYFIGQRKEINFKNVKICDQDPRQACELSSVCPYDNLTGKYKVKIGFDLILGELTKGNLYVELKLAEDDLDFEVGIGPKILMIKSNVSDKVITWFTPDKILFDHSRDYIKVHGLGDYREFVTFNLHYVGISKDSDSLSRLIGKAHENRAKILSNESQIKSDARLTDELMLFLFRVSDLGVRSYDSADFEKDAEKIVDRMFNSPDWTQVTLVSDAEKAFVRLLQTKYNRIKYKGYPRSIDGLSQHELTRYSYSINEVIKFVTASAEFNGDRNNITNLPGPKADLIAIEGETVDLVTANFLIKS